MHVSWLSAPTWALAGLALQAGAAIASEAPAAALAAPTPSATLYKRAYGGYTQVIFQTCPENLKKPMMVCTDARCGGDSNQAGFCNNILLNGPQEGCAPPGCGTFCQCSQPSGPVKSPPNQVPFQICPEAIGQPRKKCSDCGGDSILPGVCNNVLPNGPQQGCTNPGGCGYYCQCDGDVNAGASTRIVTSTLSGQTATATYTATTLSEYSGLRAATTVTTSVSSSETEVAIAILAGGVAWWLAGLAGPFVPPPPEGLPEGAEEDDASCNPEPQCSDSDCGGKNVVGLCKSGTKQNCPCQDDKQECPQQPPQCDATNCGGDNGALQCSAEGELKDCQCCPDDLTCSADSCKGNDGKCTVEPYNNCPCSVYESTAPILHYADTDHAMSDSEADDYSELVLNSYFGGNVNSLVGTNGTRAHPSDNPTCQNGSTGGVGIPAQVLLTNGPTTPEQLQIAMRQQLCSNTCTLPANLPPGSAVATPVQGGCELAIALPNNVEAWAYTGTNITGLEWQDCWDSFMNITMKCNLTEPNTGWVNGPDEYEFFQNGYRPLNAPDAKHTSLNPASALQTPAPSSTSVPPSSQTVFGISPTSTAFECATVAEDQGGWMWDCRNILSKFQPSDQICSNNATICSGASRGESYCKANGGKCDPNGSGAMAISSWCLVASNPDPTTQGCALVIADKLASFGAPGSSCYSVSQLQNVVNNAVQNCGGPPSEGKVGMVFGTTDGFSNICLTGANVPGICATI